jgi:feruloyl esterase
VAWVERGVEPGALVAQARGTGNPGGANAELPVGWSPTRTRPLCPYPQVARYKGRGDVESAANWVCTGRRGPGLPHGRHDGDPDD